MNVKRDIKVYIDGNYWNYYTGHVVYEKVSWMMPREYYKDKDEWVYNYANEWSSSWCERHGNNLRFDQERYGQNQENMYKVMEKYGSYCIGWSAGPIAKETEEQIGVYLDKEPYYSTEEDKRSYYNYWAFQECGLD